ncbi:MAG TPA: serine hydrolase [Thermoleophilaceae bacterium]|nr:serine hydrolase [Thermoleophilaceae bacterium]
MKTTKALFPVAAVAASALLWAACTHGTQLVSGGTTIDRDDIAGEVTDALAGSQAVPTLSAPPTATTGVQPRDTAGPLLEELARIAAASKGTVGVAAIDLATGDVTAFNADERFAMASTFKVPVAVYALRLAQEGRLSLTEPVPVRREDMVEPGILFEHFRHPGVAVSLLNAMELSVTTSDNGATDIILGRVGGPAAVQAWLQSGGYTSMNIGRRTLRETFTPGVAPQPADAGTAGLDRTVTPREMARFLADLHRGQLLAAEGTTTILEMMERTAGDRLALYLPPGTTVRHKTGTLLGGEGVSVNDVGYVTRPNGAVIVMAVFIRNSPESVAHSTRDRVIGHVARAIYDDIQLRAAR